ncbi:MAG TPA: ribosome maturation factor RimM [Edaphobacter sp.]
MLNDAPSWVVLAHLVRPQGRKGELLAELLTDFPERFAEHPRVFLARPEFNGAPADARSAEVTSSWLPAGRNKGRIVLHFAGIDSISAAESFAGLDVIVPREERLPLDNDSAYISDMIGCSVFDGHVQVGIVEDVQFPTTSDGSTRLEDAPPLLEVRSVDGSEVLVPFAKAFITKIDIPAKRIEMHLPSGLLEINETAGGTDSSGSR